MSEKFLDAGGLFYQRVKISDNMETEKETGFLYCKNSILGHVGVQQYNGVEVGMDEYGVVDVVREAEDVFDEDSLASMDGKPITLYHPDEMVTSENFKKYAVGFIKNVHRENNYIIGDLVINDMEAIEKVVSGEIKDLSLGYQAKLVPTGDGRLKQKNIVINHLAIVPEGRAEFARIVDENTIKKGEQTNMGLFSKKEEELKQDAEMPVEEMEDEETMMEKEKEVVEDMDKVEEMEDEEGDLEKEKESEMKDLNYFANKYNQIKDMPQSEFRTKAYDALNTQCKDALGIDLPVLDVKTVKKSVIEKSVGLADNLTVETQESTKKEPALDAKVEEQFFDRLYRSFDYKSSNPEQGKQNAKKYGDMTYRDVIDMINTKGGIK
jgi:hypothetical protein